MQSIILLYCQPVCQTHVKWMHTVTLSLFHHQYANILDAIAALQAFELFYFFETLFSHLSQSSPLQLHQVENQQEPTRFHEF